MTNYRPGWLSTVAAVAATAALLAAAPARAQQEVPVPLPIQNMARAIAGELAARCPQADAADIAAFDSCRAALYGNSTLRAHLPAVLLWGRQNPNPKVTLRQTHLTQFAPDTWTHLYAPLFMFNGRHKVEWVAEERKFVIRLEAAFRNRLPPGQFPYPCWHEEAKWSTYENANGFLFWVDPASTRIQVAQFTRGAATGARCWSAPRRPWAASPSAGRSPPAATGC